MNRRTQLALVASLMTTALPLGAQGLSLTSFTVDPGGYFTSVGYDKTTNKLVFVNRKAPNLWQTHWVDPFTGLGTFTQWNLGGDRSSGSPPGLTPPGSTSSAPASVAAAPG